MMNIRSTDRNMNFAILDIYDEYKEMLSDLSEAYDDIYDIFDVVAHNESYLANDEEADFYYRAYTEMDGWCTAIEEAIGAIRDKMEHLESAMGIYVDWYEEARR